MLQLLSDASGDNTGRRGGEWGRQRGVRRGRVVLSRWRLWRAAFFSYYSIHTVQTVLWIPISYISAVKKTKRLWLTFIFSWMKTKQETLGLFQLSINPLIYVYSTLRDAPCLIFAENIKFLLLFLYFPPYIQCAKRFWSACQTSRNVTMWFRIQRRLNISAGKWQHISDDYLKQVADELDGLITRALRLNYVMGKQRTIFYFNRTMSFVLLGNI